MKPSRDRRERQLSQAQRGQAAAQIIENEVVVAWFASELNRLTAAMVDADLEDDAGRRQCAWQIRALERLHAYLRAEAALGKDAAKQMEKTNG